jgi:hypothetical protein
MGVTMCLSLLFGWLTRLIWLAGSIEAYGETNGKQKRQTFLDLMVSVALQIDMEIPRNMGSIFEVRLLCEM